MTRSTVLSSSIVAFVIAGCGASEATRHSAKTSASGAQSARRSAAVLDGSDEGAGKPRELRGVPYGDNPLLTLYVQGPDPVANPDVAAGVYETVVTVVNDGVVPAELGIAQPAFEVWIDNERRPCANSESVEVPGALTAGEAYTFVTRAVCPVRVGDAEDVEVRTYVHFGAAGGEVDVERHYAGRYFLR